MFANSYALSKNIFTTWVLAFTVLLASCDLTARSTSVLSIGVHGVVLQQPTDSFSRTAVSEAYPSIGKLLLSVTTDTLSVADINRLYNNNKFTLNADNTAFELVSTVVDLIVPNDADITITIIALNKQNIQVFKGEVVVTAAQLAAPSVSVAIPMQIAIDTSVPIAFNVECVSRGGHDNDGDGLCSLFEDLFTNAAGIANINGNQFLNSADEDSDGDGILDKYDNANFLLAFYENPSIIEGYAGGEVSYSNSGYPMFTVANKAPKIAETITLNVLQGETLEWTLSAEAVGLVKGDRLIFALGEQGESEFISVNQAGDTIIINPGSDFIGELDPITVTAHTLGSWFLQNYSGEISTEPSVLFKEFSLNVIVLNNPAVNGSPFIQQIPAIEMTDGAHIAFDVLQYVTDVDGDDLKIVSVSAELGLPIEARVSENSQYIFLYLPRGSSDGYTVSFEVEDVPQNGEDPAVVSGSFMVWANVDEDGDGLTAEVVDKLTNGALTFDANDSDDGLESSFSDWHAAFNGTEQSGTVVLVNISADTIWGIQGSPYLVNEAIQVQGDAELIIEQGVVVRFAATGSLTIADNAKLSVLGGDTTALSVAFTAIEDPIFQSTATGEPITHWGGIILDSTRSSFIKNAAIYYAVDGLTVRQGSHEVTDVILAYNSGSGLVLNAEQGSVFKNLMIDSNKQGVRVDKLVETQTIKHSWITKNIGGDELGNGAGVAVATDLLGELELLNVAIYRNIANELGGAIWIGANTKVRIEGSTLYENQAKSTTIVGTSGIYIDVVEEQTATLLVRHVMFSLNDYDCGECAVDVYWNDTISATPIIISEFNWSDAAISKLPEYSDTNPNAWFWSGLTEDIYISVNSNSSAIDGGIVLSADFPVYLDDLTAPTATDDGIADGSNGDALDIGYHHDGPRQLPEEVFSSQETICLNEPYSYLLTLSASAIQDPITLFRPQMYVTSLESEMSYLTVNEARVLHGGRIALRFESNEPDFFNFVDVNVNGNGVASIPVQNGSACNLPG